MSGETNRIDKAAADRRAEEERARIVEMRRDARAERERKIKEGRR